LRRPNLLPEAPTGTVVDVKVTAVRVATIARDGAYDVVAGLEGRTIFSCLTDDEDMTDDDAE
jgi:hypothetical protein